MPSISSSNDSSQPVQAVRAIRSGSCSAIDAAAATVAANALSSSVSSVSANLTPASVQSQEQLTVKAQQVANKCDRFAVGILGRSGAFNKRKIPADKEQALKDKFVLLCGKLEEKGLIPGDNKGVTINPELLLARYVDKDGQLREVSLLDAYSATEAGVPPEESFKKNLDDFDYLLREALDTYDPSSLSSLRPTSIPLPAMRRSWDDLKLIGIKQEIKDIEAVDEASRSPEQKAMLKALKDQEASFTLADIQKFPKNVADIHSILQKNGTNNYPDSHKHRTARAQKVHDALIVKLDEMIKNAESQQVPPVSVYDQKRLASLKQLRYRLHEVDLFALHAALACAPAVFDESSVKGASSKIRADMESYYKEQRDIHRKERTEIIKKRTSFWDRFRSPVEKVQPIAEYNRNFAADIGGLVFSAHIDGLDSEKLRTDYYKACNLSQRDRSCIDDLFGAVMSKDLNASMTNDAIADTLLSSASFRIIHDEDKQALKDAVATALLDNA